jgi:hypothetical protein
MKRAYDAEARAILVRFLQNAIDAIENGLVSNPGDLGGIASFLESYAVIFEEGAIMPTDARTWFRNGYCPTLSTGQPIARRLRQTRICTELESVLTHGIKQLNTESEVAA